MDISRREALTAVIAASLAASRSLADLGAGDPPVPVAPDTQFTPPPSSPTSEELELLYQAARAAKSSSPSQLLQDLRFMSLHPQPAFREIVKAAVRESTLSIAGDGEPGTRIIAKGKLVGPGNKPVAGALIYVYHTSSKGWYSDKAAHIRADSGDEKHARLFGYLLSAPDGSFEIRTIRPGGYPRSDLPQHIHIEVFAAEYQPWSSEFLFDDDPRLTKDQRARAEREGFLVAAPGPGAIPAFEYTVNLRLR
ncbi:MAG: hypothetical protein ACREJD_07070 [Phycisphaerales bacterium]